MSITPGKYTAQPIQGHCILTESKEGNEQIAVEMEIVQDGQLSGESIIWSGTFASDGAIERSVKTLRLMGWTGDDWDHIDLAWDKPVEIVVEAHEWKGKTTMRVKYVNAIGGGLAAWTPLNDAKKASFKERMRGELIKMDARLGTGTNGNPATRPTNTAKPRPAPSAQAGSVPVDPDGLPPLPEDMPDF